MPTSGLSLAGFLPRDQAIVYLRQAAVWPCDDDASLEGIWQTANFGLGPLIPNAGIPDLQPIPDSHSSYIADLVTREWYQRQANNWFAGASFVMAEIDPLLAFQLSVDVARSEHHCGNLSTSPTIDELLELCLPRALPDEQFDWAPAPGAIIIRSRSLNLRSLAQGMFPAQDGTLAGIFFGSAAPLVHVVRYSGRCYLLNGFHRTFGAKAVGATHVPCVFRDVTTAEAAGIAPPSTFDQTTLESPDPPTVGHYTQGRALPLQLRATTRVLHISWSEYGLPNE